MGALRLNKAHQPGEGVQAQELFLLPHLPPAVLALADGTVFRGHSVGAPTRSVGEVVFNTALTGYQEILTDPSYCRQIVTLTYPHIGNCGVNPDDAESTRIHAAGLVIKDLAPLHSNFRSTMTLPAYLQAQGIPAIAGIVRNHVKGPHDELVLRRLQGALPGDKLWRPGRYR